MFPKVPGTSRAGSRRLQQVGLDASRMSTVIAPAHGGVSGDRLAVGRVAHDDPAEAAAHVLARWTPSTAITSEAAVMSKPGLPDEASSRWPSPTMMSSTRS